MNTKINLILIFSLCILILSCQSIPPIAEIPIMDWPQPPNPVGEVFLLTESQEVPAGAIVMDPEFWEELAAYVVAVEQLRLQAQLAERKIYR